MSTTPKHKTPNYRLVTHTVKTWPLFGTKPLIYRVAIWEPMPLRGTRKDL